MTLDRSHYWVASCDVRLNPAGVAFTPTRQQWADWGAAGHPATGPELDALGLRCPASSDRIHDTAAAARARLEELGWTFETRPQRRQGWRVRCPQHRGAPCP